MLADATGVSANFLHLSSELSLQTAAEVARRYPEASFRRETTLDHLALACEELEGRGLGGKVHPPVRGECDNEALWRGVKRGEISWVAGCGRCPGW